MARLELRQTRLGKIPVLAVRMDVVHLSRRSLDVYNSVARFITITNLLIVVVER